MPRSVDMCYLLLLPIGTAPPGPVEEAPELRDAPYFFDAHIDFLSAGDALLEIDGTPVSVHCQVLDAGAWVAECRYRLDDALEPAAVERKRAIENGLRRELFALSGISDDVWEQYTAVLVEGAGPTPDAFVAEHAVALTRLVRNLRKPPSPAQVDEVLAARARFSERDLTIVDWVGAVVVSEEGDFQSEIELMKIGNYQLLRLRTIDRAVDAALAELRAHVAGIGPRLRPPRIRTLQTVIERRLELLLEFEKTDQSLLLIGDWYSARVYQMMVDGLYLEGWKAAVSGKLESLGAIDATVRESLTLSWRRMLDLISLAGWTFLMVAYIVLLVIRL